jgi:CDP-diacylglycerol--glycerol-3-phosphate 3-phosphatidyltransferase
MTVALALTLARILISPLFLLVYLYYQDLGISIKLLPLLLISLVAIAELSDVFDGMAARHWNQVTELGKVLDPMADSIFRLSVFFTLTQGIVQLPLWLVLFFFYRDSMISTLRTICALRGFTLSARLSGKVKAIVQASALLLILLLMIPYSLGMLDLTLFRTLSFYIALAAVLYSLFSGIEYLRANARYIRAAWSK